MHLVALPLNFLEIIIFAIAVLAFGLAVRFFIQSQKRLEELFPQIKPKRRRRLWFDRDGFIVPATKPEEKTTSSESFTYKVLEREEQTKEEIKELKAILHSQQLELARALKQIDTINAAREASPFYTAETYKELITPGATVSAATGEELDKLRLLLQKKEAELDDLRQQSELSKQIHVHFQEVQAGYEELQQKVQKMEQQAWQATDLAIKLDSLEQSHEQLEKTVVKKEERVRELSTENSRLHEVLSQTEDKLSQANLQRQQLLKKVHFLEEISNDIQQMADANQKLKNELRRVAELESMLSLITEERDVLLKKKI